MKKPRAVVLPLERIEPKILFLRGDRVMLSSDLARLYGVQPRVLIQAVKRNLERFPHDFMFQLTATEAALLKSQSVISSWGGARRAEPYAFTEQGVSMLSSVIHSPRAIQINIEIIRTFVFLRKALRSGKAMVKKLRELEDRCNARHAQVMEVFRELLGGAEPARERIGFQPPRPGRLARGAAPESQSTRATPALDY
jgi:hypothetical protein